MCTFAPTKLKAQVLIIKADLFETRNNLTSFQHQNTFFLQVQKHKQEVRSSKCFVIYSIPQLTMKNPDLFFSTK